MLKSLSKINEGSANLMITLFAGALGLVGMAAWGLVAFYDWCAAQSPILFWSLLANVALGGALIVAVNGGIKAAMLAYNAGVSKSNDVVSGFERGTMATSSAITASVAGAVKGRADGRFGEIIDVPLLPVDVEVRGD